MIISKIDFRKPRQKMWGIIKSNSLVSLPYGHETNDKGVELTGYATNCFADAQSELHDLLANGTATVDLQLVEFVPYDFTMQPNV